VYKRQIAAAQGEEKIKGVVPNVSYYALKVLGSYGTTDGSHAMLALDWCVNTANPKPDIVNMSFGILNPSSGLKAQFEAACTAAYSAGIILVAGSGNDAVEYLMYPAGCTNVISVGAHAEDQSIADFSNGGVDIIAPGRRLPSMDMSGEVIDPEDGLPWLYSGTSYASPHVAGIAALVLQYGRDNDTDLSPGYFKLVPMVWTETPSS